MNAPRSQADAVLGAEPYDRLPCRELRAGAHSPNRIKGAQTVLARSGTMMGVT